MLVGWKEMLPGRMAVVCLVGCMADPEVGQRMGSRMFAAVVDAAASEAGIDYIVRLAGIDYIVRLVDIGSCCVVLCLCPSYKSSFG